MALPPLPRRLNWLPVVERGCCCSLEVCCKVLGFFFAVYSIGCMVTWMAVWGVTLNQPSWGGSRYYRENRISDYVLAGSVIQVIIDGVVGFAVAVVFLVGVYNERYKMLTPFVYLMYVRLFAAIHVAIWVGNLIPMLSLFVNAPLLCFFVYALVCANSMRAKLMNIDANVQTDPASAPVYPGNQNIKMMNTNKLNELA